MKITYYAAMSNDGFIARDDGDVAWLDTLNIDYGDTGYEEFFASVDGLIMGRKTYDFVYDFGTWPYENKLTWVCTTQKCPVIANANLEIVSTIEQIIQSAKHKNCNHLWLVGGGKLASEFLRAGLLTHLSISKMPIALGQGIPLFSDHSIDTLPLHSIREIPKSGFTQLEIALTVT